MEERVKVEHGTTLAGEGILIEGLGRAIVHAYSS